jgi:hypothetical protein
MAILICASVAQGPPDPKECLMTLVGLIVLIAGVTLTPFFGGQNVHCRSDVAYLLDRLVAARFDLLFLRKR